MTTQFETRHPYCAWPRSEKSGRLNHSGVFVVFLMLAISTLVLSGYSSLEGTARPRFYLPNEIGKFASLVLYASYGVALVILVLWLVRCSFRISISLLFFPAMYLMPALYATADGADQYRYIALVVLYLAVPAAILYLFRHATVAQVLALGRRFAFLYLAVSFVFVFLNFGSVSRLTGFQVNPNGFGFLVFFASVLFFSTRRRLSLADFVALFVIYGLVAMTGSRTAMGSLLFLSYFQFFSSSSFSKAKLVFIAIISIPIVLFLFFEFFERSLTFATAFVDSGRDRFTDIAVPLIAQHPVLGLGADASYLFVETGNMHNSYLRLALMFGLPITVVFLLVLTAFLMRVRFTRIDYPLIKVPFYAIPILFLGEDYAVGLGTPYFLYICLFIALFVKSNTEVGART